MDYPKAERFADVQLSLPAVARANTRVIIDGVDWTGRVKHISTDAGPAQTTEVTMTFYATINDAPRGS